MSVGVMASAVHIAAGGGTDVLMEPFNDFTTNSWALAGGTPTIVAGRTGTAAQAAGASAAASYNIATINQSDTITVGCAFRWTDGASINRDLLRLYSDAGATLHNRLMVFSDGALQFTRSSTNIASSTTGLMVANTWYYVEVQAKLGDSPNGTVTVRLNGTPRITATGLDSKNAGTKTVYDQVRLIGGVSTAVNQWDDLYITMGAGAAFKGNITIP